MDPKPQKFESMHVKDIPDELLQSVMKEVANYTVGFVRLDNTPGSPDLALLGTGTLVFAGEIHAALTAHHVIEVLPRTGRLGLIVSERLNDQVVLSPEGLRYLAIDRGTKDSEGPDLGAIIFAPSIAASIGAIKSFHNLDFRRQQLLEHPPGRQDCLWNVQGFVGEQTEEELSVDPKMKILRFRLLSSFGSIQREYSCGGYDYFVVPVKHSAASSIPKSYGGTSGGGLWQVRLERKKNGEIQHGRPDLSGMAFYQEIRGPDRSVLTCHGRRSIYEVAYRSIISDKV